VVAKGTTEEPRCNEPRETLWNPEIEKSRYFSILGMLKNFAEHRKTLTQNFAKVGVVSSNLIARSIFFKAPIQSVIRQAFGADWRQFGAHVAAQRRL